VGGTKVFQYPGPSDNCLLVHVEQSRFVAYSQKCTHLACAVIYQAIVGAVGRTEEDSGAFVETLGPVALTVVRAIYENLTLMARSEGCFVRFLTGVEDAVEVAITILGGIEQAIIGMFLISRWKRNVIVSAEHARIATRDTSAVASPVSNFTCRPLVSAFVFGVFALLLPLFSPSCRCRATNVERPLLGIARRCSE